MSDTIRNLQLKIHTLRFELEELEEVMKDLKTVHLQDILDNYKELGLTNETSRKIALDTRLGSDETYSNLVRKQNQLRDKISLLVIDEQFEQRKFKKWYVGNLIVANSAERIEYSDLLEIAPEVN